MPEVEHNFESRDTFDKVGAFRIVNGKIEQIPISSLRYKEKPVQENKEATKELADAVNDLMAESEKPIEDKPTATEAIPLIDKMLRATTLEEFNALCERDESVEIEGKAFTGAELKQIVSEAQEAFEKNKVLSAAKILNKIPEGPLLEKLEQLIDPGELLKLMKEVQTAYAQ